jgi:Mannosyltransferase OCH1 and related enzymes
MFPRVIHQIWFQGQDEVPKHLAENAKHVRDFYNEYDYIFWDDEKLQEMLREHPKWLETYVKLPRLIQKVDFARYVFLYLYGGIYIDMDVIPIRRIDNVLQEYNDYELIVSKLNLYSFEYVANLKYNNHIIIAKPHSIILLDLINEVVDVTHNNPNKLTSIFDSTGPRVFSNVLDKHPGKFVALDKRYMNPCRHSSCYIQNDTKFIHLEENSWIASSMKAMTQLYMENTILALFFVLIILIFVIYVIYVAYLYFTG